MNKVNVTICTGKNCAGTESVWFRQFDRILCEKVKSQIELIGSECPGNCPVDRNAKTPHVMINDQLVPNATPFEVVHAIRRHLKNGRPELLVA